MYKFYTSFDFVEFATWTVSYLSVEQCILMDLFFIIHKINISDFHE